MRFLLPAAEGPPLRLRRLRRGASDSAAFFLPKEAISTFNIGAICCTFCTIFCTLLMVCMMPSMPPKRSTICLICAMLKEPPPVDDPPPPPPKSPPRRPPPPFVAGAGGVYVCGWLKLLTWSPGYELDGYCPPPWKEEGASWKLRICVP